MSAVSVSIALCKIEMPLAGLQGQPWLCCQVFPGFFMHFKLHEGCGLTLSMAVATQVTACLFHGRTQYLAMLLFDPSHMIRHALP